MGILFRKKRGVGKGIAKRLFRYLLPHWRLLLFGTIASVVAGAMETSLPVVVGMVIDALSGKANTVTDIMRNLGAEEPFRLAVNILPAYVLAVILLGGFFAFFRVYLVSLAGQRAVFNIRQQVFGRLQRLSLSFFDKRRSGDFISRIVTDVAVLQDTSGSLKDLFHSAVTVIIIITVMFIRHWQLSLLTVFTFPILVQVINVLGERNRAAGRNLQQRLGEISAYLQEIFANIRLVKAFSREEYEDRRFERVNRMGFLAWMRTVRIEATLRPLMELCSGLGTVAVFWFGCHLVLSGSMTTGMLMEFTGLVIILYQPIKRLGQVGTMMQKAFAAAERVFELTDEKPLIMEKPNALVLPRIHRGVEFKDVSFEYIPKRLVLRDINLKVEEGEVVALVGPSGVGKTSLVNLIPRFYDVSAGAVLVDGVDVRDVTLASLRSQVGIVPQETVLFAMSVAENIAYGRLNATREDIISAAHLANAHRFISRLPDGYDTSIGERGAQLSGGERQRLAIARAILSDPRILIMDEATSSLDTESEQLIQEAIGRLISTRTTFIIAHRLSTVRRMDRILVLSEGRIVEEGDHESLLSLGGVYEKLCQAQFQTY